MSFLAAERTPQIIPPGVARITEKEDPAMPASSQALSQVRAGFKNGSQQPVILKHQTRHRVIPIPTAGKVKMLCDLYCKKPKLSLRMLTLLKTTPSYRIGPHGSRKQDGDFFCSRSPWKEKPALPALTQWLNLSEQKWVNLAERQREEGRHRRRLSVPVSQARNRQASVRGGVRRTPVVQYFTFNQSSLKTLRLWKHFQPNRGGTRAEVPIRGYQFDSLVQAVSCQVDAIEGSSENRRGQTMQFQRKLLKAIFD